MLFTPDQEYSPDNGKILYFNEEGLKIDPYGYYTHKNIFYDKKSYGQPFYEDFPVDNFDFKDDRNFLVLDPQIDISFLDESNVNK